jgi:hypothetical protein
MSKLSRNRLDDYRSFTFEARTCQTWQSHKPQSFHFKAHSQTPHPNGTHHTPSQCLQPSITCSTPLSIQPRNAVRQTSRSSYQAFSITASTNSQHRVSPTRLSRRDTTPTFPCAESRLRRVGSRRTNSHESQSPPETTKTGRDLG